jgi:hypothetical protein
MTEEQIEEFADELIDGVRSDCPLDQIMDIIREQLHKPIIQVSEDDIEEQFPLDIMDVYKADDNHYRREGAKWVLSKLSKETITCPNHIMTWNDFLQAFTCSVCGAGFK